MCTSGPKLNPIRGLVNWDRKCAGRITNLAQAHFRLGLQVGVGIEQSVVRHFSQEDSISSLTYGVT